MGTMLFNPIEIMLSSGIKYHYFSSPPKDLGSKGLAERLRVSVRQHPQHPIKVHKEHCFG